MNRFPAHAYLAAGSAAAFERLTAELVDAGIASADILTRTYDRMGIDEARELRERAAMRAIAGARRAFVVAATAITTEAQNALLKTLEEPAADALFIIVVPNPDVLLPTLRSRVQVLALDTHVESSLDVRAFLAAIPAARLELLKALLAADERDLGEITRFLSALEAYLEPKLPDQAATNALEAVYAARAYLGDKGALVKPLLESVALVALVIQ